MPSGTIRVYRLSFMTPFYRVGVTVRRILSWRLLKNARSGSGELLLPDADEDSVGHELVEVAVELGGGRGGLGEDAESHVVVDGGVGEVGAGDEGAVGVGDDALGVEAGGEGRDGGWLVGGPAVEVDLSPRAGAILSLPGRVGPCWSVASSSDSRISVMWTPRLVAWHRLSARSATP